ncbi:MAG: hypothetical protein AAGH53_09145 [Pseudomonadota bacterium]
MASLSVVKTRAQAQYTQKEPVGETSLTGFCGYPLVTMRGPMTDIGAKGKANLL